LSLSEAESVEDAVFGSVTRSGQGLVDRATLLAETGLTEEELRQAETVGVMIPSFKRRTDTLRWRRYPDGRDSLRRLIDYGLTIRDLAFFVELGDQIVKREMDLRRRIVSDKTTKENTRITAEISERGIFTGSTSCGACFNARSGRTYGRAWVKRSETRRKRHNGDHA